MHTYLPATATINAYLKNYLRRMELDTDTFECRDRLAHITWVPLGSSGRILLSKLVQLMPEKSKECVSASDSNALTAIYNRKTKQVYFSGFPEVSSDKPVLDDTWGHRRIKDREVIVLDSSVHSGKTMKQTCHFLQRFCPRSISSFTFCLKRGSHFIPNYFALLIHDWDRSLFWLEDDGMPVNRLGKGIHKQNIQLLRITSAEECADLDLDVLNKTGQRILALPDKRFPEFPHFNYACLHGNMVCGTLTFQLNGTDCLVCQMAAIPGKKDLNIPLLLLRWAETCGRHNRCDCIKLIPADIQIRDALIKRGFEPVEESELLQCRIMYLTKTLTAFPDDDMPGYIFGQQG